MDENEVRFNWNVGIGESEFYSLTSVPIKEFGEPEGQFTADEISSICDEFSLMKHLYPVNQDGARKLKQQILEKLNYIIN